MERTISGLCDLDQRVYYSQKFSATQNFGDYLPEIIYKELLCYPKFDLDVFRLIGSVIEDEWIVNDLRKANGFAVGMIGYWCCGMRKPESLSPKRRSNCVFFGARGPKTRDILGLPSSTPLGDPGLLAPLFHTPRKSARTLGRSLCIPHFEDRRSLSAIKETSGADVVLSPVIAANEESLRNIIDDIVSADFVLSGSLHSAIIAAAFERPFAYLDSEQIDCPFKWQDFSSSINISCSFSKNITEGEIFYRSISRSIRMPSRSAMLDCCPFSARPDKVLEAFKLDGLIGQSEFENLKIPFNSLPSSTSHDSEIRNISFFNRRRMNSNSRKVFSLIGHSVRALVRAARRLRAKSGITMQSDYRKGSSNH